MHIPHTTIPSWGDDKENFLNKWMGEKKTDLVKRWISYKELEKKEHKTLCCLDRILDISDLVLSQTDVGAVPWAQGTHI